MDSFCPSRQDAEELFDELRRSWVKATPEEHVRQRLLKKMVGALHFPKELIVIEKELKELPHIAHVSPPERRIDILCYAKDISPHHPLYPLLLIECKEEMTGAKAADQLIGYNAYVKACFIALVDRKTELFGYFDKKQKQYVFHTGFPSFKDLNSWVKQSNHL